MKHLDNLHTHCEITMHYFGSSLKLESERFDPREEVCVEQQHCGGNTLTVFRRKIMPGGKDLIMWNYLFMIAKVCSVPGQNNV